MDDIRKSILKILDISSKLNINSNILNIENEVRMIIPNIDNNYKFNKITLQYYKCLHYPYLTIRREVNDNDDKMKYLKSYETKEVIDRVNINNVNIVCSVEKKYSSFTHIIKKDIVRYVERVVINNSPLTIINRENNILSLEIEFTNKDIDYVLDTIIKYNVKYWPCNKPIDAYSSEILSAISNDDKYYISPKYDGEHSLLYYNSYTKYSCILKDNGNNELNNNVLSSYNYVYEVELCGINIYILDILMINNVDITNKSYIDRLSNTVSIDNIYYNKSNNTYSYDDTYSNVNILKKDAYLIDDYKSMVDGYNNIMLYNNNIDGIILTNSNSYYNIIYKSKHKPTVDLQYIRGYLFLAREKESNRACRLNLEEGKIYEFDTKLNLIKIRHDKIIPNYYMPVDIDVMHNICTGIGIPCLRYHHNKVKLLMLSKYNGILLDIGCGLGGDVSKWNNYDKVYAVDPINKPRINNNKVVFLKSKIQNVREFKYDVVSIFFVPWDNYFIDVMLRSKHSLIIIMDKAYTYRSNNYNVNVNDNVVNIEIPNTNTAINITEVIPDISYIDKCMIDNGYSKTEFKCDIKLCSYDESILSSMYSYIIYSKNSI